jgi:CheY-like chemotaxis protein
VARVLVIEPHSEVRELLLRIVRRLGHEAVVDDGSASPDWIGIDVVLVEPAAEGALDVAANVGRASGATVVCVSIYPPSEQALALRPIAYLQKPFSLVELERALVTASEPARAAPAA